MRAVTSALVGRVIAPGEPATIATELAVPDLDLIKQDEGAEFPVRVAANRLSTSHADSTRQAGTGSANPFSSSREWPR